MWPSQAASTIYVQVRMVCGLEGAVKYRPLLCYRCTGRWRGHIWNIVFSHGHPVVGRKSAEKIHLTRLEVLSYREGGHVWTLFLGAHEEEG